MSEPLPSIPDIDIQKLMYVLQSSEITQVKLRRDTGISAAVIVTLRKGARNPSMKTVRTVYEYACNSRKVCNARIGECITP